MKNLKEFYIIGEPIETDIGLCDFIKVKEYPDFAFELQTISLNKLHLIYKYQQINKNHELDEFINELNKLSLFEIVFGIPELRQAYLKVFLRVFNDGKSVAQINQSNFEYYRKLVMDMNCVKEELINPNPEIQRAIERSRRVKQRESGGLEFADIVTSIVGFNGLSYKDIKEMTIYQLYMTFHRIAQIKGYDTNTLFATVSTEKINIESWCKHIDLLEDEKHFVTQEEFNKKTASVLNE